jgi:hypothetical protein
MTIEERLEAITHTLELTARMRQDSEQRLAKFEERTERELASVKDRLTKLEDNMIVQGELVARLDRRMEEFVEHTERWMNSAENRFAQLEVTTTAILERLDRFIAGQRSDAGGGQ